MLSIKCFDLTPEMHLMLACSQISLKGEDSERIKRLSHGPINWEAFLKLVERHRMYPLVYRSLGKVVRNGVPKHVLIILRNRFEKNARRSLELTAELARLVKLFQQGGIPVVALKGPTLALQVYGDLGLRHAGDLDLFLMPEHVNRAGHLLHLQGYQQVSPDFVLGPRRQAFYMRYYNQFAYSHNARKINVELHWRWVQDPYLLTLSLDNIWDRLHAESIGGTRIATLGVEDTILYLCTHGSKHGWYRLFWLYDLAGLINKNHTVDWAGLMALATERGAFRPLVQGVVLSNLLFGRPLPDSPHAVSVAIPLWSQVVGYEEGEPEVRAALNAGYPRFIFNALTATLLQACRARFAEQDELCLAGEHRYLGVVFIDKLAFDRLAARKLDNILCMYRGARNQYNRRNETCQSPQSNHSTHL